MSDWRDNREFRAPITGNFGDQEQGIASRLCASLLSPPAARLWDGDGVGSDRETRASVDPRGGVKGALYRGRLNVRGSDERSGRFSGDVACKAGDKRAESSELRNLFVRTALRVLL